VIYNLRSFALEGGEELKGEAIKMLESAVTRRIEMGLADPEPANWDIDLLRQELLMHYMLTVSAFDAGKSRPTNLPDAIGAGLEEARAAFDRKLTTLNEFADRLLALVMLNVIDEKWKDHLYDLDQLRNAIHYRSWGQKDPLVEYKQEAYTMFEDLMHDVQHTFTERFLKVQLVFEPPPESRSVAQVTPVKKSFDAMGVAEPVAAGGGVATAAPPRESVRAEPTVIGAGRVRSLEPGGGGLPAGIDLSKVGRNDLCPCGSGKKFKKCHGANG
jgi:preprotein translocase subunit SecA